MKYYCGHCNRFVYFEQTIIINWFFLNSTRVKFDCHARNVCLSAVNTFSRCAPLVLYCRRTNIINSDFSEAFARFEGGQGDVFNYPRRNKVRAWVAKGMCLYTIAVSSQNKTTSHFGAFDTPRRHTYSHYSY